MTRAAMIGHLISFWSCQQAEQDKMHEDENMGQEEIQKTEKPEEEPKQGEASSLSSGVKRQVEFEDRDEVNRSQATERLRR